MAEITARDISVLYDTIGRFTGVIADTAGEVAVMAESTAADNGFPVLYTANALYEAYPDELTDAEAATVAQHVNSILAR